MTIEIWPMVCTFLNIKNSIIILRCQIFYGHLSVAVVPFPISADNFQGLVGKNDTETLLPFALFLLLLALLF